MANIVPIRLRRTQILVRASLFSFAIAVLLLSWQLFSAEMNFLAIVVMIAFISVGAFFGAFALFAYLESDKSALLPKDNAQGDSRSTGSFVRPTVLELRIYPLIEKIQDSERRLQVELLHEQVKTALRRLHRNSELLLKRGNVNLVVGSFIAVLGVLAMGWPLLSSSQFVPGAPGDGRKIKEITDLLQYVPTASIVILLETLAYFFLRLYRDAIGDIKYFSNEISTLEARYTALIVSTLGKNEAVSGDVLRGLAGVERNVVLSTGQSTFDIEKLKIDKDGDTAILGKISELLGKKN